MRRLIRLEWHPLGPRVYLLGVRVHEWHLGLAILAALGLCLATDLLDRGLPVYLLAAVGVWAISKDWRDITAQRRDTASWRLGLHRPPRPLSPQRRAWVARLSSLIAGLVGVVNLVSALTPNIGWRGHLLRNSLPFRASPIFHALALPLSALLLLAAFYLYRRRRRAFELALAVLVALGFVNLLKGLDFEEAALSWLTAAGLWWGRDAFSALPSPLRRPAAIGRAAAAFLSAILVSLLAVGVASPDGTPWATLARELADLLLWQEGPLDFTDEYRLLPVAVGLLSLTGLLAAAWLLFRPWRPPRELPDAEAQLLARNLVRAHGHDTLAYFKLRRDKHYRFAADLDAFLGYRFENGSLVVSGDPVGAADSLPGLLKDTLAFAARHGLAFGVLGASQELLGLYRQAGLKTLYIGDEALVDVAAFSLEGRAIRKVRQSVSRLEKAGYRAELVDHGSLSLADLAELEQLSALWRGGEEERGFSMAMDSLGAHNADSVLVLARDGAGHVRGFLHFVPSFGRAAYSLSFMRRHPDTPNGLTEFLVVQAILGLKERGVVELSLNFAALSRFLRERQGPLGRLVARALRLGDRFFQIERLYRFNAKFFPRWEPRYLVYDSTWSLPRLLLAALWLEGQLPRPWPPREPPAPSEPPGRLVDA